jgi:hypothetical protein
LAGTTPTQMRAIWPTVRDRFFPKRGRLRHIRLDRERQKQADFRSKQQEKGKAGARRRWDGRGHAPAIAQAMPKPWPDDGSSSSIFDLQTAVKEPPIVPLQGGRLTRKELTNARETHRLRFGRCDHDPGCPSSDACIRQIALERRANAMRAS